MSNNKGRDKAILPCEALMIAVIAVRRCLQEVRDHRGEERNLQKMAKMYAQYIHRRLRTEHASASLDRA